MSAKGHERKSSDRADVVSSTPISRRRCLTRDESDKGQEQSLLARAAAEVLKSRNQTPRDFFCDLLRLGCTIQGETPLPAEQ